MRTAESEGIDGRAQELMKVMNMTSQNRRALIVGLGITGMSAALRLRAAGWNPVILERAPERRRGGYFVYLFEPGAAAAERLGVLDAMRDRKPQLAEGFKVDRSGKRFPSMNPVDIPGGPRVMLRGDIENALHEALPTDLDIRFSTVPTSIAQDANGVDVTMLDTADDTTTTERFDLVIGADGVRSTVRRLTFGPDSRFLHPLGCMIAATVLDKQVPGFTDQQSVVLSEVGRAAIVYGFADHPPAVLMAYLTDDIDSQFAGPAAESLRTAFGPQPLGSFLTSVLDQYEAAPNALFDSAVQVRMPFWHTRRVVLLGDAAWCPTLWAGMGASSGMAGADLLGDMLEAHPDDLDEALASWESRARPYIAHYQQTGVTQRKVFAPDHAMGLAVSTAMGRLMVAPGIGPLIKKAAEQSKSVRKNKADWSDTLP